MRKHRGLLGCRVCGRGILVGPRRPEDLGDAAVREHVVAHGDRRPRERDAAGEEHNSTGWMPIQKRSGRIGCAQDVFGCPPGYPAAMRSAFAWSMASLLVPGLSATLLFSACVGDEPTAQKADAAPTPTGTATTTATAPPDSGPPTTDSSPPPIPDAAPPDSGPPPDGSVLSTRLVFVTDAKVDGSFAGAGDPWAAADAICATEARANSLPGTYVAWLSWEATTGTKFNAASRITDAAYSLPGGPDGSAPLLIATSKTELLTTGPRGLMNRTGSGVEVDYDENTAVAWVWTGTAADGTASLSDNCSRWTTSAAASFGTTGNARRIPLFEASDWTSLGGRPCNLKRRFYCFQK